MKTKGWLLLAIILFTLHLLLLVVSQFTAWPEMLFWPYLILKGWLPYRDIGIAHSPLLVVGLTAFYNVFGIGIWQQKLFSWLAPLITDGLLLYFFSKLFGVKKALLALVFYILFQVYYDGNGIWFDHALTIFSLTIFYFLEKKNHFLTGVFWALALLTKQTAFWFSLPVLYYFLVSRKKKEFVANISKGIVPVISLFLLLLIIFGIQKDYFVWSIVFGIGILPKLAMKVSSLRMVVASLVPYLVFLPLFAGKLSKKPVTVLIWSVAAMMGAIPRFELFHFQPALPFLALAFALATKRPRPLTYLVIAISLSLVIYSLAKNIFRPPRFQNKTDAQIVTLVDKLTTDNELIFVTNYWDNLYPLTNTLPATRPFIPQLTQYLSQPGFEDENVSNLISNPPKIVVRGQFTGADDPFRFEKINSFIDNNYQVIETVGSVDILIPK